MVSYSKRDRSLFELRYDGITDMSINVWSNDMCLLSLKVIRGKDVDEADLYGATPLHWAALKSRLDCMTILLKNGRANADIANNDGATPLHISAECNSMECVSLLMKHGVAMDVTDADGRTALWWASMKGHQSIAELLVQSGADIDIADNDGKTAIVIARENDHAALATYLDRERTRRRRPSDKEIEKKTSTRTVRTRSNRCSSERS